MRSFFHPDYMTGPEQYAAGHPPRAQKNASPARPAFRYSTELTTRNQPNALQAALQDARKRKAGAK